MDDLKAKLASQEVELKSKNEAADKLIQIVGRETETVTKEKNIGKSRVLRSSYTMRTKCAISDAFVRYCVFAYCASVAQYVFSLSSEHCF